MFEIRTVPRVQVFVVKDRGLLKFVFTRPPNVVGHNIKKFKEDVEKSLGLPDASLNLYDTQFYSKNDGSLDFSSTGSCFQLVGLNNNYNAKDTVSLLEDPSNHELKNVYKHYEVKNIEVKRENKFNVCCRHKHNRTIITEFFSVIFYSDVLRNKSNPLLRGYRCRFWASRCSSE